MFFLFMYLTIQVTINNTYLDLTTMGYTALFVSLGLWKKFDTCILDPWELGLWFINMLVCTRMLLFTPFTFYCDENL
jgi:hypothetical protein